MTDVPAYRPRGQYFEEFQVGQQTVTAGRTITEADIVNFAALSGDYNQLHTDAEFARKTPFGQRIAHGLLVLAVGTGLVAQTGALEGTVLAFRELSWKFVRPVFVGDTVHLETEVSAVKLLPRVGGGNVTLHVRALKQTGEVVARGEWQALMASRPK